jgi:hypothetical protein
MYNTFKVLLYSIVRTVHDMDPLHFTIAYTNYLDFQIISCVYVANLVILKENLWKIEHPCIRIKSAVLF